MRQQTLCRWLQGVLIGVALCALVVYGCVLPVLGLNIVAVEGEAYRRCLWPWLCFLWATAPAVGVALVLAWRIAANIGADRSFCRQNAVLLARIAYLAAWDTAFFFVGDLLLLALGFSHPGVALAGMLVVFAGVAVSVAAAALSHLVYKAAVLQDESDLTV